MAKNAVNLSRKYNKNKSKQGQSSRNQENKGKRRFKLKRKEQNQRQSGINNRKRKTNNVGVSITYYFGDKGIKVLERQNNDEKSGNVKQRTLNYMQKSNMKRNNRNTSVRSRNSRPNVQYTKKDQHNSSITNNQEIPKLFTKNFDARKRIETKRQAKERKKLGAAKNASKAELDLSRKQQRDTNLNQKRNLSLSGDNMKITSRIDLEKNRHTLFTGNSLQVTTMRTEAERNQERAAVIKNNNAISITTENTKQDFVQEKPSEYSLFEARRKAMKAMSVSLPEHSASAIPAVSKLKKSTPVFVPEVGEQQSAAGPTRVLVTNLHPNVSQDDIYELFGSLAPLKSWRLLRTGAAEVVYKNYDDAVLAYGKYHGRNLDGQPMICKIVASEKQIYMPPTSRPSIQDSKAKAAKETTRPVVFTVKI